MDILTQIMNERNIFGKLKNVLPNGVMNIRGFMVRTTYKSVKNSL